MINEPLGWAAARGRSRRGGLRSGGQTDRVRADGVGDGRDPCDRDSLKEFRIEVIEYNQPDEEPIHDCRRTLETNRGMTREELKRTSSRGTVCFGGRGTFTPHDHIPHQSKWTRKVRSMRSKPGRTYSASSGFHTMTMSTFTSSPMGTTMICALYCVPS